MFRKDVRHNKKIARQLERNWLQANDAATREVIAEEIELRHNLVAARIGRKLRISDYK